MKTRKPKKTSRTPKVPQAQAPAPAPVEYPVCPHCSKPVANVKWLPYGDEVLLVSHDLKGCNKVLGTTTARRMVSM